MKALEELKEKVNQAYIRVVECSCYKRKASLLQKFQRAHAEYIRHKNWVEAMQN